MPPRWGGSAPCQPSHRSNEEGGSPSSRSPEQGSDWIAAAVSVASRFRDDIWSLHIQTAAAGGPVPRRLEHRIAAERADQADDLGDIDWNRKRFLWTMATDPPSGRKRSSARTLRGRAAVLRILLLWMAAEGIMRFAEIDRRAVGRSRPGYAIGRDTEAGLAC